MLRSPLIVPAASGTAGSKDAGDEPEIGAEPFHSGRDGEILHIRRRHKVFVGVVLNNDLARIQRNDLNTYTPRRTSVANIRCRIFDCSSSMFERLPALAKVPGWVKPRVRVSASLLAFGANVNSEGHRTDRDAAQQEKSQPRHACFYSITHNDSKKSSNDLPGCYRSKTKYPRELYQSTGRMSGPTTCSPLITIAYLSGLSRAAPSVWAKWAPYHRLCPDQTTDSPFTHPLMAMF